jgi:hypothetical protein
LKIRPKISLRSLWTLDAALHPPYAEAQAIHPLSFATLQFIWPIF